MIGNPMSSNSTSGNSMNWLPAVEAAIHDGSLRLKVELKHTG